MNATHQLLFQSDVDFIRQKHECHTEKHISFLVTNKEAGLELNDGKLGYTWSENKVRELGFRGIVHYEFVPNGQTVNQVTTCKY